MTNSVPLSNAQTRWRNPVSVCSSSAGSVPISALYQGPLMLRSRTVSATWLSAGKVIVDSSLFTCDHRLSRGRAGHFRDLPITVATIVGDVQQTNFRMEFGQISSQK